MIVLAAGWVAGAQGEEPSPTPAAAGPVTVGEVGPVEVAAGASSTVHVPVRVADGHRVQANPASNEFLVPLELLVEGHDQFVFGPPAYPKGEPYLLEGADEPLMTYAGEIDVAVPVSVADGARCGTHVVSGELRYQACNSRMCLFPASMPIELQIVVSSSDDRSDP